MAIELLELHYYQAISVFLSVVCFLALVLNSSVIIVFLGNRSALLIPSNYLLLSMAFSDVLRAILVLPVAVYANYNHLWMVDESICQYIAFASTLLGLSSMVHLVSLALQRWITIKRASLEQIPERKMATFVVGLWLFSLMWSLCPLFGWSSFGPEPGYAGCAINWHPSEPSDKAFIVCLFIFFFFLPVAIATFCYIRIYVEVRKMAKNAVQRWGTVAIPTQETLQAKARTVKMSLVMLLAFLVAWTPYAVVSMYSSFTPVIISPLLSTLPALFAKFSTCYNPIIFFFMYSKFRKAGKEMLTKFFVTNNPIVNRQRVVVLPLEPLPPAHNSRVQIQDNESNQTHVKDQDNNV